LKKRKISAEQAASSTRNASRESGWSRIVAATGAAQFEFPEVLTKAADIDWRRVEMFHLDEYVGLPMSHAASFRRFLQERLIQKNRHYQRSSSRRQYRSVSGGPERKRSGCLCAHRYRLRWHW
jgi:6-phosphogluconolactonase/glucosamine-6-phosphate isomerase/deaminase